MHNPVKVTSDMYWVGASDRRLALFENVFPIPKGISYNSYLVLDEKTVLLDTADRAVSGQLLENIAYLLDGRALDYLIVNHMEPDHAASMGELVLRYPGMRIVCNAKALAMIRNYFDFDIDSRVMVVQEGDTLDTGRHSFSFVMAPMVHWPEAMVTYDAADRALYSADAFGTFGALNGNIFADEVDFEGAWLPEARRYYTNIVGKYGNQVQALLKKASALQIDLLCPLHGPIWRTDIPWFMEKYSRWSAYVPEDQAVMIAYASVYGGTENAANILAAKLAEKGVRNIAMYDVSNTHPSVIVSEAFRCSHLVFASTTYNAGIFCNMETALLDIKAHNLQNRTVAIMENGSWAPTAGSLMRELIGSMKGMTILEEGVRILSSLKAPQMEQLEALAEAIAQSLPCSARTAGCPSAPLFCSSSQTPGWQRAFAPGSDRRSLSRRTEELIPSMPAGASITRNRSRYRLKKGWAWMAARGSSPSLRITTMENRSRNSWMRCHLAMTSTLSPPARKYSFAAGYRACIASMVSYV